MIFFLEIALGPWLNTVKKGGRDIDEENCRMFDRSSRKEVTLEASREVAKPKTMLKPRKVGSHIRNPDSA